MTTTLPAAADAAESAPRTDADLRPDASRAGDAADAFTPKRRRVPALFGGELNARDLVLIGVFAAAAKLSAIVIALAGGGLNPLALILKNTVVATLLVVLLVKVAKPGTIMIYTAVTVMVGSLLSGSAMMLAPGAVIGAFLGEMFWRRPWLAVGVSELIAKFVALAVGWVLLRESPQLMKVVVPVVLLGATGTLFGLWLARSTVKELRHAGFLKRFA